MGKTAKTDLSGTYVLDDDVMEEMENLEATTVMQKTADLRQDSESTAVLDEIYRLKISGDEDS
jgi:hypothetical protein